MKAYVNVWCVLLLLIGMIVTVGCDNGGDKTEEEIYAGDGDSDGDSDSDSDSDTDADGDETWTMSESRCLSFCQFQWDCIGVDISASELYNCDASCGVSVPLINCLLPHMDGICREQYIALYTCQYGMTSCDQYDEYAIAAAAISGEDTDAAVDMTAPCALEYQAYWDNCATDFDDILDTDSDLCADEIAAMEAWADSF